MPPLDDNSIKLLRRQDTAIVESAPGTILDAATRRNLEIDKNLAGGDSNTLFSVMDKGITAMGSRMLRRWLHRPLTDTNILESRHVAIAALCNNYHFEPVRSALKPIGDMERILTRVALRSARPRDLTRLAGSLEALPLLLPIREAWLLNIVLREPLPLLLPLSAWLSFSKLS